MVRDQVPPAQEHALATVELIIGFVNKKDMKLIVFAFCVSFHFCHAQTFKCGAQTAAGTTYKLEMDINITDSLVVFVYQGRESIFKRLPSTTDKIYFTDGQVKNSLYAFPNTGTKKGFIFNHIITQEMNLSAPRIVQCYCWLDSN